MTITDCVEFFSMLLRNIFLLFSAVKCWDDQDHELLYKHSDLIGSDLNDRLQKVNQSFTFYSLLQVEPSASESEIQKAYRKQSMSLHPDKNPSEEAKILYKLLTSVQGVLKDKNMRERYDKFLKKGFPVWRGILLMT